MQNRRTSQILTSLATMSCLALLLADSAEPYCGPSKAAFDRTFDYVTTCNGDHSGRIRISTKNPISVPVSGGRTENETITISTVSGEAPNATAIILGDCDEEDDPTFFTGVQLNFNGSAISSGSSTSSSTTGSGGDAPVMANCTVKFSSDLGKNVDCKDIMGNAFVGCTLQLTALP